jgi:hypothetical protein
LADLFASTTVRLLDFGCQNEVALGEAIDFVGPDLDGGAAPGQMNVGVVSFGLRNLANHIRESEGGEEVREPKLTAQVMSVHDLPIVVQEIQKTVEFVSRKRRYPTTAGSTGLRSEIIHLLDSNSEGLREYDAITTRPLCSVQGVVGRFHELLRILPILGEERDAERGGQVDF